MNAADVEVTAVNVAIFDNDSIRVVSPGEAETTAKARRRVSPEKIHGEGGASVTGAHLYSYKYPSVDADGNKVMLSSLMAVPTKMIYHTSVRDKN